MKKFLTIALVLVMTLTLSANVFADEIIGGASGQASLSDPEAITPTVSISTLEADTIYRVDIKWTDISFQYTEAYDDDWDPENLTYKALVDGAWDIDVATITVTNRSNADVTVSATAAPNAEVGVDYTFTGNGTELDGLKETLTRADTEAIMNKEEDPKSIIYTLTIADDAEPLKAGNIATIDINLSSN